MKEVNDGLAYAALVAKGRHAAADQADELRELTAKLAAVKKATEFNRALGQAARDLAAELVRETAQADAGKQDARRLSAPGARDLRNAELAKRAREVLIRGSGSAMTTADEAALASRKLIR